MRILGIDPGLRITGFGCIESTCDRPTLVEAGVFRLVRSGGGTLPSISDRLDELDRDFRVLYAQVLQGKAAFDQAYEQFLEALAIGPRDAHTEFLAGMAASSAGYTETAAEHFELALGGESDNAVYALHLGLVEFNLDRLGPAKAHLTIARQLDEESAMAWGMLAQIELRQGRRAIAGDLIDRARQLDPASIDSVLCGLCERVCWRARKRGIKADRKSVV